MRQENSVLLKPWNAIVGLGDPSQMGDHVKPTKAHVGALSRLQQLNFFVWLVDRCTRSRSRSFRFCSV